MFLTSVAYASTGHEAAGPLFSLGPLEVTSEITTMWGVMILILVVSYLGTRNMKRIPSGVQNVVEMGIEMYENFWTDILGRKRARQLMPILASFFILILCSNYSGLLPLAGTLPGLKPPTSNVSTTAGLAIIVFVLCIYYNIKTKGIGGYLKHFLEPIPILLPINILEQFTRPLSLALRLYGSIYGEEMVVASLAALGPLVLPLTMQVLGILFGAIQAFVFTLLASIYLEEATAVHH